MCIRDSCLPDCIALAPPELCVLGQAPRRPRSQECGVFACTLGPTGPACLRALSAGSGVLEC
eukprot:13068732-Alexandrium_andersonii.AAC.1